MAPIEIEGGGSQPWGALWPGYNNQPIGVGVGVRGYIGEKGSLGKKRVGMTVACRLGGQIDRRKNEREGWIIDLRWQC